ncbi:MAG: hypothetical protein WC326_14015 [Candidatus Delongbacteria bacterium]
MSVLQRASLCLLVLLVAASGARAQALVRLVMPECAEPYTTLWLEVRVELQPGQTLKSYDIRIPFDPTQVTLVEAQVQQGSWFQSGGPTFFWRDIIDNQLIVNAAILGPGLHVTGSGMVFRVQVQLAQPAVVDLQAATHLLFDVNAVVLPSLELPAALQAPCTDLGLQISHDLENSRAVLDWNSQGWTADYRIYGRPNWGAAWELLDSTTTTGWSEPLTVPERLYQVRARFTDGR